MSAHLCGGNNVEAYARFEWSVRDQLWNAYLWKADYENWCYDCSEQVAVKAKYEHQKRVGRTER